MATTEIAVPDIGDYQDVPVIEMSAEAIERLKELGQLHEQRHEDRVDERAVLVGFPG